MSGMASQITSLTIVYSTVYPGADQRKHQSPASLAFVRGIHRGPMNSPHKWPVTRKLFPFDDVIMHFVLMHYFGVHSMSKGREKNKNCHDATGRAVCDDKVSIMITLGFQCIGNCILIAGSIGGYKTASHQTHDAITTSL